MAVDLNRHPCFNADARHTFGRIHLPVAPKCNVQCNYCNRKYDCANENRPGVTTDVLSPAQALYYVDRCIEQKPNIAVVGIAGPGDAFATPDTTLETLRLVRKKYPDMLLCVASNGLNVAPYANELKELDVSHVTITLNAIDPEIGAQIYAWVRDDKRIYRGIEAAKILLEKQFMAITALKKAGVTVKINSIIIPALNDDHIKEIAKYVSKMGADILNSIPLYPVADTPFEDIPAPRSNEIFKIRKEAGEYLPQMQHCTRCRADAFGLLGENKNDGFDLLKEAAAQPLIPNDHKPYVAVASREGVLVNQHLGESKRFFIFEEVNGSYQIKEQREAPRPGGGYQRWQELAEVLHDCRTLLAYTAGDSPANVLKSNGIKVVLMEGLVEEGLRAVYEGTPLHAPLRRAHRCGSGCSGNGSGCD